MENSTSDVIEFSYEELRSYNIELINDLKEMRERNRLLESKNKRLTEINLRLTEINRRLAEINRNIVNGFNDYHLKFKRLGANINMLVCKDDITEDDELFDENLTLN